MTSRDACPTIKTATDPSLLPVPTDLAVKGRTHGGFILTFVMKEI